MRPMQYASGNLKLIREGNGQYGARGSMLRVIERVNSRYLDYLASTSMRASKEIGELFAAAGSHQPLAQLRIARMPFLLADLHFHDGDWWASWTEEKGATVLISEIKSPETAAIAMARHVLITAWHLAHLRQFTVFPVGISAAVASSLAMLAPHELDLIAVTAYSDLKPRWTECPHFWSALFAAAGEENDGKLAELQIHALRLLQHEYFSTRVRV